MPLLSEAYSDARLNLNSLDRDIKSALTKVRRAANEMQAELRLELALDTSNAERNLDRFAASVAGVKARIESDGVNLTATVDTARAAAAGREAREAVETGFGDRPLDLNVDLDFEAATFYGRVARLAIEEGFGTEPIVADVTADFDAALFAGRVARDSLEAGVGVAPIQVEVDVDLGSLVTARAEIDAITRFDEDVRLNMNTRSFDTSYAKVVAKLEALTRRNWTVDINSNADVIVDLIDEVIAAAKEADRLKVGLDFDFDARAAREAAAAARERVTEDATPTITPEFDVPDAIVPEVDVDTSRLDARLATLLAELDALVARTNTLTFSADGDDAIRDAVAIRRRVENLLSLIQSISVGTELQGDEELLARLAVIDARARQLDAVVARLSVEVRGSATAIAELGAVGAAAAGVDGNDVNIDVNRRGGLSRGLGSLVASAGQAASAITSTLGQAASAVASTFTSSLSTAAGAVRQLGEQAGEVFSTFLAAPGKALAKLKIILLPAIAAIIAGLAIFIVGAISTLTGPVLAGIGALIGGAIAFLLTSAVTGLAAAGLPILAVVLGPAKEQITRQLEPLKEELLNAFAPTTDLIVNRIVPAFTEVASRLLPIVARVSEEFITPIADSLLNLLASPALADAITRVAEPMAQGIASIIDVLTQFAPLLTEVTLAIGPPLTAAVNALLSGLFTGASVFADDIAAAFQVVTDLFERLRTPLTAVEGTLAPMIELLAELVVVVVEAGAQIRQQFGDELRDTFQGLLAEIPKLRPLLVATGAGFIGMLQAFVRLLPVIRAVIAALTFFGGGLVTLLGVAVKVGLVIQEFLVGNLVKLVDMIGGTLKALSGLPGVGGAFEAVGGALQGLVDVYERGNAAANGFANSALMSGSAAVNLSTDIATGGDRLGEFALTTATAQQRLTELRTQLERGEITVASFVDEVGLNGVPAVEAMASVVDDLNKRLDEGALSVSNFADAVTRELPSAADFVVEVEERTAEGARRSERDQQRRLRDLRRQTERDVESVQRAAEDYQEAVKRASEVRAEAPERYTFGPFNYNQVLAREAEERQQAFDEDVRNADRAVQERARALEDARIRSEDNQIDLSDALADQVLGPDGAAEQEITRRVIDIRAAVSGGLAQIAAEAEKARTLADIRLRGREFDPLADFLETLDPEQFVSAIDQLGGTTSAAFDALAEKYQQGATKGNTTLEEAFAQTQVALQEELTRLARIDQLLRAGRVDLVNAIDDLDAESFNDIFEGLAQNGGEAAFDLANAMAAELTRQEGLVRQKGADLRRSVFNGLEEGTAGELLGLTESVNGALDTALGGRNATRRRQLNADDALSGVGLAVTGADGPVGQARAAGEETARAFSAGFDGVWQNEQAESLTGLVDDLFGTIDYETFAVAGQTSAGRFFDGLESAFQNQVNRTFAVAALGSLLVSLRLKGEQFSEAGVALGGSLNAGIAVAIDAGAAGTYELVRLLGDGIDTSVTERQFRNAGETLGDAVLDGFAEAVRGPGRDVALGALGTMRIAVLLQEQQWLNAGLPLGEAVGQGLALGIQSQAPAVVNAAATLALLVTTIIRSAFRISSPSRVMADIGADVTRGLAVGIGSVDDAERAAASAVRAAQTAALAEVAVEAQRPFTDAGRALGEAVGVGLRAGLTSGFTGGAAALASVLPAGVGSGVGAGLPEAAARQAALVPVGAGAALGGTPERVVVEETTINLYGVQNGLEGADEVARRQRDRRFKRGRM